MFDSEGYLDDDRETIEALQELNVQLQTAVLLLVPLIARQLGSSIIRNSFSFSF